MSSLVLELQNEASTAKTRVSDLLRKTLIIAKKLKIQESVEWIENELNGYSAGKEIPEYRVVTGEVRALNPFHGWIPVFGVNDELKKKIIGQSITQLEALLREEKKESSVLIVPFPEKLERLLLKGADCLMKPALVIDEAQITGIIESVRTAILQWTLKLEENGILGKGMTFSAEETLKAQTANYNITNYFGDIKESQIQQGTYDSKQIMVQSLDLAKVGEIIDILQQKIEKLILDSEKIDELKADISTIKSQLASPKPKQSIIYECLHSIKRILEGVASNMITAGILERIGNLYR